MRDTSASEPLSTASVNFIELRMGLAFAVTVLNSGCRRESEIDVRLAASGAGAGEPFTGQRQIDQIDPGEEKTVLIGHLSLPVIDERFVLTVEVEPVPTEVSIEDNSVEYPVRFVVG